MDELKQREIFKKNLLNLINQKNLSQVEIAKAINVSPQTFNTWVKGIAIPRMGKIQTLADYFGVNKTDLIEEPLNISPEEQEKGRFIAKVADRMISDDEFREVVKEIDSLNTQKLSGVKALIVAFKE